MRVVNLLIILVILVVLLTSFAYANYDEDLAACGNNVRCKFRIAAQSKSVESCSSLSGVLSENCKEYVKSNVDKKELEKIVSDTTFNDDKKIKTDYSTVIGMIIVLIAFIFSMLFLFFEHFKHVVFIRNHDQLMNYVKNSLSKGLSEREIGDNLRQVGWSEKIIIEALRDAKNLKK